MLIRLLVTVILSFTPSLNYTLEQTKRIDILMHLPRLIILYGKNIIKHLKHKRILSVAVNLWQTTKIT